MLRRKSFYVVSILLLSCVAIYFYFSNDKGSHVNDAGETPIPSAPPTESEPVEEPSPQPPVEEPDSKPDDLFTLEQKVGQLLIAGIEHTEIDEQTKTLIEGYEVGGFILFKRNLQTVEQSIDLLNGLKQLNSANNALPLLLSVDEEGGRVTRAPDVLRSTPTAREIGSSSSVDYANDVGQAIGYKLHSLGFNTNFAPVLDVQSNPANAVIGDRSFHEDADVVAEVATDFMKGMREQGIITAGKHFPGHGDTYADSHVELPAVNHTLERLREVEFVPFRKAIEEDIPIIMTAHIMLTALDETPATLSHEVVTKLLREELGFTGVVITDDLTMSAIIDHFTIEEASIQALEAGVDLLLISHGYELVEQVRTAIVKAVDEGRLTEERIDESFQRILTLKEQYRLNDEPTPNETAEQINSQLDHWLQ